MLDKISKYFSPELLATIYSMGHGDESDIANLERFAFYERILEQIKNRGDWI
ncbi:MAG: hypothetical protein PVG30_08050 [Gammaproteobacteria bacterium]